ncbi:MAG TPA: DUF3617 family protein [Steroidobacteraceae bacterium]|nr:DUF3617 family protein [Steroidobacteraceae bacterium]
MLLSIRTKPLRSVTDPRAVAAALALLSMARAADLPPLKEGLWEIHGQSIANPGAKKTEFSYRLCRNHAYDSAMDALVKNTKGCTTSLDDLGGGRFSASSSCNVEGTVVVSKGTYIYESSTSARSESYATFSPAYHGKTDETVIQDQRYLGDCPSGMKPGDRIMGGSSP